MQDALAESDGQKKTSLRAVAIGTAVALLILASVALLFLWLWSLTGRLDGDICSKMNMSEGPVVVPFRL